MTTRVRADPGRSAADRGPARTALASRAGGWGGDPRAERRDPSGDGGSRSLTTWLGVTRALARSAAAACAVRRRDDGTCRPLLRGRTTPTCVVVPGRARHVRQCWPRCSASGRDLPTAERFRARQARDGRGRAADGRPAAAGSCSRPTPSPPAGRSPRWRRASVSVGAGLRTGERGHLHRDGRSSRGGCYQSACAHGRAGSAARAAGPAVERISATRRTSNGAWPRTTSGSSRAGRSRRCSRSSRPPTERTTCTSQSVMADDDRSDEAARGIRVAADGDGTVTRSGAADRRLTARSSPRSRRVAWRSSG